METGLVPHLNKIQGHVREGLMPGEGQRFVSKHSTPASERLILLFWNLQKGKKRSNIQCYGKKNTQSIQNLRDRYDSKAGIRTVAATLLCARYWECVLCQHSASHSKLHIMLKKLFLPWILKATRKKKICILVFFLEPLPITRSYT